ncbi:hypothetical protein KDW_14070 [Dictyobacter vulcani]|uniref:Uncharacterized protein n=1 Tax=Dictyobacter vulcani TaxID=2607529 RepID=A0A5J4KHU1_9CHLR|nr:DUF4097 family beta strand repeat-containing protein [Dictyobacter vulcani]GER87245.1 hypothetical protein KDW_14070 [Dictyobacter vulcani]
MSKPDSFYLETGEKATRRQKQQKKASQSKDQAEQTEIQEPLIAHDPASDEVVTEPEVAEAAAIEPVASAPIDASENGLIEPAEHGVAEQPAAMEAGTPIPPPPNANITSPYGFAGRPPARDWRFSRTEENGLGRILLITLAIALVAGLLVVGLINKMGTQNATENYFFQPQARQKIIINNDTGAIHIHGQLTGPFGFQVSKYSEGMGLGLISSEVTYNQDGAKTIVNARLQPDFAFAGSRGIDIDVAVPQTAEVEAYTITGTITVTGTVGQVSARTNTGSIEVENSSGRMTLQAETGSIAAHNVKGQLIMKTSQGDVEEHQVQLSNQSSAVVGNGAITFNGSLERNGSYRFTTTNGPINLSLPSTAAFHLILDNSTGPVTNDFGHLSYGRYPQAQIVLHTQRDAVAVHKLK